MAPPGGFKLKVGVEGPTMQALRSEPARRPEAPNPTLLNPCFVSFPASLTRQLLRLVSPEGRVRAFSRKLNLVPKIKGSFQTEL